MARRQPYPLQWLTGQKRTKAVDRRHSKFGAIPRGSYSREAPSAYEAAKELLHELKLLGAANSVITSQLPTRNDGLPYADGRSDDPGIAVWFVLDGHERVFACDHWHKPGENLRAIALSIGAMRGLERWGMSDVIERAFAGFTALPPGDDGSERRRPWREVLDLNGHHEQLAPDDLVAIVKARHRKLIAEAHPDAGGTTERAAEINSALDEALAELSP